MRPDVSELIGSLCRILENDVAPEIADDHPREVLRGVVGTLRAVQEGWVRVLPFLAWDNRAMASLLGRVREGIGEPWATRLDTALAGEVDPTDALAAQARNQALRTLLAQVLADGDDTTRAARAPVDADILTHLEERARRTPIRHVPELPRAPTPAET